MEFINSKRRQIKELIGNKEVMTYLTDTLVVLNDNSPYLIIILNMHG